MSITPEIAERMALDPEPGEASRLVESCGVSRGPDHAKRWTETNVPECARALSAEYAGRGVHGGLVYMVTYALREDAGG